MNLKSKIDIIKDYLETLEDVSTHDHEWNDEQNLTEFIGEIDQIFAALEEMESIIDTDKEAGVLKENLN